jgi:hypothetical protein
MTQQHPITPPSELLQLWFEQHHDYDRGINELLIEAAQYGADHELEACCMEIIDGEGRFYIDETSDRVRLTEDLWTTRRPKPSSLSPSPKWQALVALENGETASGAFLTLNEVALIRRALEQLPDHK